jgi:hypothetical protein
MGCSVCSLLCRKSTTRTYFASWKTAAVIPHFEFFVGRDQWWIRSRMLCSLSNTGKDTVKTAPHAWCSDAQPIDLAPNVMTISFVWAWLHGLLLLKWSALLAICQIFKQWFSLIRICKWQMLSYDGKTSQKTILNRILFPVRNFFPIHDISSLWISFGVLPLTWTKWIALITSIFVHIPRLIATLVWMSCAQAQT